MALGVFQNRNITDYMRTGKFDPANTGNQYTWINPQNQPAMGDMMWLDKISRIQCRGSINGVLGYLRIDPNFADNESASILRVQANNSAVKSRFGISAYVPSTGEQRMFGRSTGTTPNTWKEVDYTDPSSEIDANPLPFVDVNGPGASSSIGHLAPGDWDNAQFAEQLMFFGWDRKKNGSSGTVLMFGLTSCHFPTIFQGVTGFVDMDTGACEPVIEMPSRYSSNPQNIYQGGPLLGSATTQIFIWAQFIPDFDSTPTAPKGQILIAETVSSGDVRPCYTILFDFNPEGVTSFPERIHWRIRQTTIFEAERTTDYATYPGATSNLMPTSTQPSVFCKMNTLTGRQFMMDSRQFGVLANFEGDVFHSCYLEATSSAVISVITPPVPRVAITTNRVVIMGSEVRGSLGEAISGETVQWTLERITTRAEVLVIPEPRSFGDAADPVASIPIDQDPNYPFEVRKDGTPLVQGVDYTVNDATGVVTFEVAASEPVDGAVYDIDYGHPATPATPAIGTLLAPTSVTDENAAATTRIRYEDEPANAGFSDKLTGTTTS